MKFIFIRKLYLLQRLNIERGDIGIFIFLVSTDISGSKPED